MYCSSSIAKCIFKSRLEICSVFQSSKAEGELTRCMRTTQSSAAKKKLAIAIAMMATRYGRLRAQKHRAL